MKARNLVAAALLGSVGVLLLVSLPAHAGVITFENLPTGQLGPVSFHNATGPILADDFIPAVTGAVERIDWWGSAAASNNWEIVFHTNSPANTPNIDNATTGGLVKHLLVVATGVDPENDGIFSFSAGWSPMDLFLNMGTTYWVTIANFSPGWNWALAGLPTVGNQAFAPQESLGGICTDDGLHCGPWNPAAVSAGDNLAFRISVPEPATLVLLSVGLAGIA